VFARAERGEEVKWEGGRRGRERTRLAWDESLDTLDAVEREREANGGGRSGNREKGETDRDEARKERFNWTKRDSGYALLRQSTVKLNLPCLSAQFGNHEEVNLEVG
jgi:hypothetical protein